MSPEFSRLIPVDRIPLEGASEHIAASEQEREALAARFGVLAVHALSAQMQLEPWRRGGIKVSGHFDARVKQTCVVTLEPFEEVLREDIRGILRARMRRDRPRSRIPSSHWNRMSPTSYPAPRSILANSWRNRSVSLSILIRANQALSSIPVRMMTTIPRLTFRSS